MRWQLVLASFMAGSAAFSQPVTGLWDATVTDHGLTVPFRFELSGSGSKVRGSFVNGDDKLTSTRGRFEGGALALAFDHYGSKLEATLRDGKFDGTYTRANKVTYAFHASRFIASSLSSEGVPPIAGVWEVPIQSSKGELAWRFIVRQAGPEVSAAILRVDGDTGTLYGKYENGRFHLTHFAGGTPVLIEVTPQADGSLELVKNGTEHWSAFRSTVARAKGLPQPTDPSRHTSVKDPTEPFRFAFPDLNGKMVTNEDPRFRNKVVIIALTGSWCPNCHDEAPFLVELYRKFHARGLEIVALSFEEPEQQKDLSALRSFVKQYGIPYPVLYAGAPDDLNAKLPQTVNLNAWPTTFYIGRDGLVKSVHAGFAGPASGDFHRQGKEEITALVEKLLAENVVSSR